MVCSQIENSILILSLPHYIICTISLMLQLFNVWIFSSALCYHWSSICFLSSESKTMFQMNQYKICKYERDQQIGPRLRDDPMSHIGRCGRFAVCVRESRSMKCTTPWQISLTPPAGIPRAKGWYSCLPRRRPLVQAFKHNWFHYVASNKSFPSYFCLLFVLNNMKT